MITQPGRVINGSGLGHPLRNSGAPVNTTAGTNEVQTLTGTATGGSAALTVGGQSTPALPYNATAAAVQAAVRALSSVNGAFFTCTGGPLGTAPVVCTFSGDLGNQDQPAIAVGAGLTGGTWAVAETTKGVANANGTHPKAAAGALLIDETNKLLYQNTGTAPAVTWSKVGLET